MIRLFRLLAVTALLAVPVSASTSFVSPLGAHVPPFATWADAATNIQAAIDLADSGGLVIVSNGYYPLITELVLTNGAILRSLAGSEATTVDAAGSNRCIRMRNAAVDGFSFINGLAPNHPRIGSTVARAGGGIYAEASSILNCLIASNSANAGTEGGTLPGGHAYGGAVYLFGGGMVSNCLVNMNAARGGIGGTVWPTSPRGGNAYGGGIWCEGAQVTACELGSNSAEGGTGGHGLMGWALEPNGGVGGSGGDSFGGGIYVATTDVCTANYLHHNTSRSGYGGDGGDGGDNTGMEPEGNGGAGGAAGAAYGGGVYCSCGTNVVGILERNVARGAQGGFGGHGGDGGFPTFTAGNGGNGGNGGMALGGGACAGGVVNCLVAGNTALGGGLWLRIGAAANATVCSNTAGGGTAGSGVGPSGSAGSCYGGGVYVVSNAVIANAIIVDNVLTAGLVSAGTNWYTAGTDVFYLYCCTTPTAGLVNAQGCLDQDPQFADADSRLGPGSPCLDAGTNELVAWPYDLDSLPRVAGDRVDLGASERQYPFVDITNALAVVDYAVAMQTIGGTNTAVRGMMAWSNLTSFAAGQVGPVGDAMMAWAVPGIALVIGSNMIVVSAGNPYGSTNDTIVLYRRNAAESAPRIATNALIFPSAGSGLLAGPATNIAWDPLCIDDDLDGTNLTITLITVVRSNDLWVVSSVTGTVANLDGAVPWLVPDYLVGSPTYYLRFEAVDSSALTSSLVFTSNPFTVVPEPAAAGVALGIGCWLLGIRRPR